MFHLGFDPAMPNTENEFQNIRPDKASEGNDLENNGVPRYLMSIISFSNGRSFESATEIDWRTSVPSIILLCGSDRSVIMCKKAYLIIYLDTTMKPYDFAANMTADLVRTNRVMAAPDIHKIHIVEKSSRTRLPEMNSPVFQRVLVSPT